MPPDASLLARAAACYERAGVPLDAVRCYRAAGNYRPAARIWEDLGAFREAARDYAAAGVHELAAWIFAHHVGDIPAARAELAAAEADAESAPGSPGSVAGAAAPPTTAARAAELRRRITRARCNAAENAAGAETLAILGEVMEHLEHEAEPLDGARIEERAVQVAEAMNRPDLVALVFAAAVRGGRYHAAERWNAWSLGALGVPLLLPEPGTDPAMPGDATAGRRAGRG